MKYRPSTNKNRNLKKYLIMLFVVLCFAGLGAVGYFFYYLKADTSPNSNLTQQSKPLNNPDFNIAMNGFISVRLFFPHGAELKQQDVRIQTTPIVPQMVEMIVAELIKLMPEDLRDIQLISAYKDRDAVVYLDFSAKLTDKAVFDVSRENLFLSSLYQTLNTNIQGLSDIRILVEGKEIETIAGHFNISNGVRSLFNEPQRQR
ncbi:MAG: GerMN domain-containing protein [Thermodesulfovibrionales bacterium]|nr:GerMN domain-containing protein [Thermodesulfovibrionales bacterium]